MRPLTLHTSALNDAEYTLFTENLASLLDADCDDPDAQILTIREVRAWLRGRYPVIPSATIDRILALFPSKDSLNGGEFFAVLRLVLHVEAGKEVDRALAFIQVHPESAVAAVAAPAATQIQAPKEDVPTPPPPSRTPQRHNPFLPPTPTLARSKTMPSSSSAPVLPPRKAPAPAAAPLPPPRHPPLPPRSSSPPKPSTGHITSTLMKQSLQASKTGQWMKQGQARLEQERVLQVLRSTSSTPRPVPAQSAASEPEYLSSSSSDGSRSRPHSSIPPSTSSLEQVALAGSSSLNRAFDDAYRGDTTLPPPLHPDRKSAPPSASSRVSESSSRLRVSPERIPRQKPKPPPKPRSLNSVATQSPFESPVGQTRLTRSNSLRPSPPPPSAGRAGRTRPESVHALLGSIGALRLPESPFGDPVRPRREDREALVSREQPLESEDSSSDSDPEMDGGWVGVGRFDDPDANPGKGGDIGVDERAGGGRGRWRSDSGILERDSLKWPVDVEGEGWRPL